MLVKLLATKPEQVGSSLKELVLYLSGHAVSVLAPEGAQTFQLNGIIPARVCWHITAYVVFNGHLGSSGVPESFKFSSNLPAFSRNDSFTNVLDPCHPGFWCRKSVKVNSPSLGALACTSST